MRQHYYRQKKWTKPQNRWRDLTNGFLCEKYIGKMKETSAALNVETRQKTQPSKYNR